MRQLYHKYEQNHFPVIIAVNGNIFVFIPSKLSRGLQIHAFVVAVRLHGVVLLQQRVLWQQLFPRVAEEICSTLLPLEVHYITSRRPLNIAFQNSKMTSRARSAV